MGLIDKFKKKKVLQQDLSQKEEHPGQIFMMYLLMKDKCEMPDKDSMTNIMKKHLGDVDCFCHDNKVAGFAVNKYKAQFNV